MFNEPCPSWYQSQLYTATNLVTGINKNWKYNFKKGKQNPQVCFVIADTLTLPKW
jgi:hypothetical protein